MSRINIVKPSLTFDEISPRLEKIINSGIYSNGTNINEFSAEISKLTKAKYCFPTSSATTAFVDFADAQFTSASFTANGALIYNTTTDGGSGTTDAVCVLAFGGDFTASNGTFTVQFPAANTSDAIIRIS